ncbi:Probable 2-oxoglutarate dehydrogenase E1 component DHKTD1 homolog, mitochondrial [Eumeta japonica]|uniref:Probable 2-oxoglutarate dehydrogenase E1 component DHKTD1 homolog, mitochondrial n=1 Tax=Eumeta variegata TaxID=151549 RepID=A0A4C2A8Q5_EUMVA|nr:Probable 2-oxoglutarate dehydrogenase E1 component DHKTD1 homolog, mitochondrial [Eumeta japonica]
MAHRGKLNVLSGLLRCPPVKIFHKISGNPEFPDEAASACDISTHLSSSTDITINGKSVRVSLLNNPSHLEAINPVSMGKTRSKQMYLKEGDYSPDGSSRMGDKVLNVQIHGDAAFTGQGVNQETLMLTQAPHFHVGGSIHVVVNNQVGFTLPANRGRSSRYVTDLAKAIATSHTRQRRPPRDKTIICRNTYQTTQTYEDSFSVLLSEASGESDEHSLRVPARVPEGCFRGLQLLPEIGAQRAGRPDVHEPSTLQEDPFEIKTYFDEQWFRTTAAPSAVETWDTGVDTNLLKLVAVKSVQVPSDFHVHPHLDKVHIKGRLARINEGKDLDWATAEVLQPLWLRSLPYRTERGSLLMEGRHVRLSGEDVGRGTFSHRHVMLVDQSTGNTYL